MIREMVECDWCQKEIASNLRTVIIWLDGTTRMFKVVFDTKVPSANGTYHCHKECAKDLIVKELA